MLIGRHECSCFCESSSSSLSGSGSIESSESSSESSSCGCSRPNSDHEDGGFYAYEDCDLAPNSSFLTGQIKEPVDASDDEEGCIIGPLAFRESQVGETQNLSITFKWFDDPRGETCENEESLYDLVYGATASIRMRLSDTFDTGDPLVTTHNVFGIEEFEIEIEEAPDDEFCSDAGWTTYSHELEIPEGGLEDSYFNDALWDIEWELNKQQRIMISAMEVCVTSGRLR